MAYIEPSETPRKASQTAFDIASKNAAYGDPSLFDRVRQFSDEFAGAAAPFARSLGEQRQGDIESLNAFRPVERQIAADALQVGSPAEQLRRAKLERERILSEGGLRQAANDRSFALRGIRAATNPFADSSLAAAAGSAANNAIQQERFAGIQHRLQSAPYINSLANRATQTGATAIDTIRAAAQQAERPFALAANRNDAALSGLQLAANEARNADTATNSYLNLKERDEAAAIANKHNRRNDIANKIELGVDIFGKIFG